MWYLLKINNIIKNLDLKNEDIKISQLRKNIYEKPIKISQKVQKLKMIHLKIYI